MCNPQGMAKSMWHLKAENITSVHESISYRPWGGGGGYGAGEASLWCSYKEENRMLIDNRDTAQGKSLRNDQISSVTWVGRMRRNYSIVSFRGLRTKTNGRYFREVTELEKWADPTMLSKRGGVY